MAETVPVVQVTKQGTEGQTESRPESRPESPAESVLANKVMRLLLEADTGKARVYREGYLRFRDLYRRLAIQSAASTAAAT